MELRTPLCDELGIDFPILSVGFAISAGQELAGAVSKAGGCGVLGGGSGGFIPPDEMRRRIARVRELTERPFGVNFIIANLEAPDATQEERAVTLGAIAKVIEQRVPLLVLFWGDPGPVVEDAHRNGVKVFVQVGSVDEAKSAASAGVDAVIAQGIEAGGHVRGSTSVWDLVPAVVESVGPVPVLASGGIGDGAGIARALRLGAQGVSMGTRFVASEELTSTSCTSSESRRAAPRTPSTATCSMWGGRTRLTGCWRPRPSTNGTRPAGPRRGSARVRAHRSGPFISPGVRSTSGRDMPPGW